MRPTNSNEGQLNSVAAAQARLFSIGRWWVVGLVAAVVAGQLIYGYVHRPAHLDAIAEECGNVSYMLENQKPSLSHAENRLLFCHSTEKGVGVFICNIAEGNTNSQKKMIFEEMEIHFGMGPHGVLKVFPWSPDDRLIVYAHQGQGAQNGEFDEADETLLTICRSANGIEETSIGVPFGQVIALAWLNESSFVYVAGKKGKDFYLVQQQDVGHWTQTKLDKPDGDLEFGLDETCTFSTAPSPSFAAISSNTIAWLQAGVIWMMNVSSNETKKLVELPKTNGIVFKTFDYSPANRTFLLSCVESNADSLWSLSLDKATAPTTLTTVPRRQNKPWTDAVWLNLDKGFAYKQNKGGNDFTLLIRPSLKSAPSYLFDNIKIEYFSPVADGKKILVVGALNNQPGSGIWLYDVTSRSLNCIVPASDQPLAHFTYVQGIFANIQIANRVRLNTLVFPPVNFARQKPGKHPVVIASFRHVAMEPYLSQYAEAVANAGGYFILIDHPWSQKSMGGWEYYMANIYSNVVEWPCVDKNRVFLMSNSAQAEGLLHLLTEKPGICQGAILLVPSLGGHLDSTEYAALTAHGQPPRILITAQEGVTKTYLGQYQIEAAKVGIPLNFVIHPGTPHEFIAKQSQRDRIKTMLDFIFKD